MKVYKINSETDNQYAVVSGGKVKTIKLCEAYNQYGQKIGCYDAGCYCLDNSGSSFLADMAEEFGWENDELFEYGITSDDNLLDALKQLKIDYKEEDILAYIEAQECHSEGDILTHSDGANYRSYYVDSECGYSDLESIDEELEAKILSAYSKFDKYCDGVGKQEEIDGFTFHYSRYSDFPYSAIVEI